MNIGFWSAPYSLAQRGRYISVPRDIEIDFPTRAQVQSGMLGFKDWPMVSVAVPVGSSTDPALACPFVSGGMARYPKFPGDPDATFQFPTHSWLRGLLGGYLDGGDLPVTRDPTKCPALLATTKACSMTSPCNTAAGEVCGKVVVRAAPAGTGIIAGGPMRAVFESVGVHDVVAKSMGSSNPYNLVRATFDALKREDSPRAVAARRGLKVSQLQARRREGGEDAGTDA